MKLTLIGGCLLTALMAVLPSSAMAASPAKKADTKPAAKVVGLFEGMEAGDIEVKVIPKNAEEATVTIKNKTGKPLTIKLPDAVAGVPVLAQGFGGNGGGFDQGGGGGMGGGMGGGNQGFGGGGFGGGGMGGGGGFGGGGGGGFFNLAADKVIKSKIVTVCLDHGKKDPNPRVPYQLIRVESYAKSAAVSEVVKMLAKGELDQHSAQAAVWHLQNGLTWEELAAKIGAKHLDGSVEVYFTSEHLQRALAATRVAADRAEQAARDKSQTKPLKSASEQVAQQD